VSPIESEPAEMHLVCLDLEGVLVPEIWIALAERTGIESLRRTTRDEPDYDRLMRGRLELLRRHGLGFADVEAAVATLAPLEGARTFLDALRSSYPIVILSDTFQQFAGPLIAQLGWPTLLCHELVIAEDGGVADYRLRMLDHKRQAVEAFQKLNYTVIAVGDSYNDTTMLAAADRGILFRAPEAIARAFPQFPLTREYGELRNLIDAAAAVTATEGSQQVSA
jgi:phosphoserine/homoserine phosphotransferase